MRKFEAKTTLLLALPCLILVGLASFLSWRSQQKPEAPYQVLRNEINQEACPSTNDVPQQCLVHRVEVLFHPINFFQRRVLGQSWTDGYGDLHAFNAKTGEDVVFFAGTVPEHQDGLVRLHSYSALSALKAENAKIVFEANLWWSDAPRREQRPLILRQSITPDKLRTMR